MIADLALFRYYAIVGIVKTTSGGKTMGNNEITTSAEIRVYDLDSMDAFATVANFNGGRLTVLDKDQHSAGQRSIKSVADEIVGRLIETAQ